jgi:acyl-CoA synthetase (AMP-forming)/AMP-acid ligase II
VYPIDFFFRAAEQYPDRIALDGPEGQVTYARLAAEVRALAAALQDLDPAPQTRVAICAGNSARHILALLAVLASGKVWVPLNYRSTEREIGRILDATEPSIVIVDGTGAPLAPEAQAPQGRRHVHLDDAAAPLALDALLARHAGRAPQRHALPRDATQAIKFTGGTTGLPKGVMQPYHAWNAGIINQIANWELTREDRYVVAAPITHGTGTYLLPVLARGGAHLLLDTVNPASITAAFRERGGTLSFMPPTLIYMIMAQPGVSRADFPRLRNLIYGGAPMPVEKIDKARAFFGPVLGTTYGQTEAPQIVTALRPADLEAP